MKALRTLRNYVLYCGIEKEEYRSLKKDAYVSNFNIWRVLHCVMALIFAGLALFSFSVDLMAVNRLFYLLALAYSLIAAVLFLFVLRKDSIIAQLMIYLSISLLFLFSVFITKNNPTSPATTFIVLLIITPMFMIDKPFFMAIELIAASVIYLVWMRNVKTYEIWRMDLINITLFAIVGIILHVIANSIRIREIVLSRRISIQKDTDELTGLKNKGALTRAINEYLQDETKDKGILFVLDIDRFKSVNDTYGHDVGDIVIRDFGFFLGNAFPKEEIVGRFGGDEFIVFLKDVDDPAFAKETAERIVKGVPEHVKLPDGKEPVSASLGISVYHGQEKNYSELFKKADIALYKTKADRSVKYNFYEEG